MCVRLHAKDGSFCVCACCVWCMCVCVCVCVCCVVCCVCVNWTCWRGSSVDTKSTRLVGSVYAAALEIMLTYM